MVNLTIGSHKVEIYDAIDELPIVRFHKYQKLLLIDAGVGGDIAAFDKHIEKVQQYLAEGKAEHAQKELENLRQNVFMVQNELTPRHRAFAALVASIDGKPCDDLSDEALSRVTALLGDAPKNTIAARFEAVKKKIDTELVTYFPTLFDTSEVKEYFNLLRKRTLAVLNAIAAGEHHPEEGEVVRQLTAALVTYSNPQTFTGSRGVEVQFDRQFEDLCLALSEQLHVTPKALSVLEFYNAFDFIQARARELAKKAKGGR